MIRLRAQRAISVMWVVIGGLMLLLTIPSLVTHGLCPTTNPLIGVESDQLPYFFKAMLLIFQHPTAAGSALATFGAIAVTGGVVSYRGSRIGMLVLSFIAGLVVVFDIVGTIAMMSVILIESPASPLFSMAFCGLALVSLFASAAPFVATIYAFRSGITVGKAGMGKVV